MSIERHTRGIYAVMQNGSDTPQGAVQGTEAGQDDVITDGTEDSYAGYDLRCDQLHTLLPSVSLFETQVHMLYTYIFKCRVSKIVT